MLVCSDTEALICGYLSGAQPLIKQGTHNEKLPMITHPAEWNHASYKFAVLALSEDRYCNTSIATTLLYQHISASSPAKERTNDKARQALTLAAIDPISRSNANIKTRILLSLKEKNQNRFYRVSSTSLPQFLNVLTT